jgi:putative transcriptional regulator
MHRVPALRIATVATLVAWGACAPTLAQVERSYPANEKIASIRPVDRGVSRGSAPAAGKFLVARRDMPDPNFARTVVLLLDYGMHGALGLVINRPSHVLLSTLAPEIEGLEARTDPIYVGGPVPSDQPFILFRDEDPPEGSKPVFQRVHVSRSAEVLGRLVAGEDSHDLRVFAGYAGWAPGQLDNELARGDWHVVEADEGSVFSGDPDDVWEALVPPEPTQQARLRDP